MTMFSVLKISAAAVFLSSPGSSRSAISEFLGFDMLSHGHYWWGTEWHHEPANGGTGNCVCATGVGQNTGKVLTYCAPGIGFETDKSYVWDDKGDVQKWHLMYALFDGNKPIDVTTTGSDGLWVDRFMIHWTDSCNWQCYLDRYPDLKNAFGADLGAAEQHWESYGRSEKRDCTCANGKGGKARKRFYGGNNTNGWCLSTEAHEDFDSYANNGRCYQTISLNPNGNVYQYRGITGYHKPQGKAETMHNTCKTAFAYGVTAGRRRMDGGEDHQVPTFPMPASEAEDVTDRSDEEEQDMDIDPAGLVYKQSELQGQVHSALRSAIKQLVTQNSEVTDEQIDELLNSAMLAVEEQVSGRVEREHELEGGLEQDHGSASVPEQTGSTPLSKRLLSA